MRVRSTFKTKKKAGKSVKVILRLLQKKANKLLSLNILHLPALRSLGRSGSKKKAKSYLRRDVHKKSFENPYPKKVKTTKVLAKIFANKRYLFAKLALVVSLFIWFIVLFVQPTFYIDRIAISGNQEIQTNDLRAMITEYMQKRSPFLIKRSHLFFFNESTVEEAIRERYGLESITFTSHWPSRSLQIDLKEKSSILVYSVDDQYFTIDKKGTVIRQTDHEEIALKEATPTIYQFSDTLPEVGQQVLTEGDIQSILTLYNELQKYPYLSIHSFRLKPAEKQTVIIPEKLPESNEPTPDNTTDELNQELEDLADSIAQAQTVEDKISQIKSALSDIDIEKLEEGEIERYLEQEKVFEPNESIQFDQLEVYTTAGWSLLLGTEPLQNPGSVKNYLDIFATLNSQLAIEGEVKEYIDLRFPHRVYYR